MLRRLYWVGVVFGAATLVAGAVVATLGIAATPGPGSVVRDYYHALSRGDAPTALAYGTLPRGPRLLLTSKILAEQQHVAPIHHISIASTAVHGERATVEVKYVLEFPDADVPVTDKVRLHKRSGDWRLDRVAVGTDLEPDGGSQRLSVLGDEVPTGRVLLFPGALPIRTDTSYLQLEPFSGNVSFDSLSSTIISLQVSDAGRAAMLAAVRAGLRRCLAGRAAPTCPLPSERFVPGSVRGMVRGNLRATLVSLSTDPVGTLRFAGSAELHASWTRLNFHNRPVRGHGTVLLHLRAIAYAADPLELRWILS